jgi:protein gp37
MGDRSGIAWTDATLNPIRSARPGTEYTTTAGDGKVVTRNMVLWGCEKVSPACDNCYASTLHVNHGGHPYTTEGLQTVSLAGAVYAGKEPLQLHEPTLLQPLHWTRPRRIFVCSMTDLFGDWVPDAWLDKVFGMMALAPHHTFQLLTKRPKRMRDYINGLDTQRLKRAAIDLLLPGMLDTGVNNIAERLPEHYQATLTALASPVLPHVWCGTTIESQDYLWRFNYVAQTRAAVRWVSGEPLLGPLNFGRFMRSFLNPGELGGLDWVVVGGESGPGYRPMSEEWARQISHDCHIWGIPFFYKQSSGLRPAKHPELDGRVREEFPAVAA